MKPFIRLLLTLCSALVLVILGQQHAQAQNLRLFGAGGTFPLPVYSEWFHQFSKDHPGIEVDYQGMRSGAGVESFIRGSVNFAGSDKAMTDEQIARVEGGAALIPITAGSIVLGYNLPGDPKGLKLPREVYPEIFRGKIARWNNPKIAAANPDLALPDLPITVVVRSDASGTDFVFTRHLSAIDPAFAEEIGENAWPNSPQFIQRARNEGIAAEIKARQGAIGYLESSFTRFINLTTASIENRSGNYVDATTKSGEAALASVKLDSELRGWATDPESLDAYPISTFTWLIFRKRQNEAQAKAVRELVDFCVSEASQAKAEQLGYIPLPPEVVQKVQAAAAEIK